MSRNLSTFLSSQNSCDFLSKLEKWYHIRAYTKIIEGQFYLPKEPKWLRKLYKVSQFNSLMRWPVPLLRSFIVRYIVVSGVPFHRRLRAMLPSLCRWLNQANHWLHQEPAVGTTQPLKDDYSCSSRDLLHLHLRSGVLLCRATQPASSDICMTTASSIITDDWPSWDIITVAAFSTALSTLIIEPSHLSWILP